MSTTTKPRNVIVCMPTNGGSDWSTAVAAVSGHTSGPTAPSLARFPVRHRKLIGWVTRFTTRHLLGAERHLGVVTHAAGGRRSRLHLEQAQHAAWYQATARWAIWKQITNGLRQASGWDHFERRHLADPKKYSLDHARKQFLAQPMVMAMLAYNANPANRWELDPYEVDAYLAGSQAYATCHMLSAVCGDAMFTTDGQWLEPAGDSFAEICVYLKQAADHIHQLNRHAMVVAMTSH